MKSSGLDEMPISTIKLLENLADYCAVKNKVISKNLANVGTEGYKREDVEFKSLLDQNLNSGLKTTNAKHMGGSTQKNAMEFDIVLDKNSDNTSGANNVDVEKEMSELAENTLRFKFASKKIGDHYKILQSVIKGDNGNS